MFILSVGFFIFIERKFLGLGQYREGPNKTLFKGYFQFIFDIFKLLVKDFTEVYNLILLSYFFIPFLLFVNMFLIWVLVPLNSSVLNLNIGIIYLIVLMIIKIYYLVLIVFYIYSYYRFIRMLRIVIQVVSYDVVIILVIIFNFFIYVDFDFRVYVINNIMFGFIVNLVVFLFWVIRVMVELIRLPFDFYEGESELVSGFNIEYGSFLFLVLVLIEYMEIVYFMVLTVLIFVCYNLFSIVFVIFLFKFIFLLIWFRVFFVRYRIDKILIILWKFIFPIIILLIFFYYYLCLV